MTTPAAISRSTLAPMISKISIKLATSEMSGTPSNVTMSSAKIVAGIKATTEFLAPDIVTSPEILLPPFITIFFIFILSPILKCQIHAYSFYHKISILTPISHNK